MIDYTKIDWEEISKKEIIKFIVDNFCYSNIGMNEDGEYGENKVSWMWKEGYEGKMTEELRQKIINIIKRAKRHYYT